VTIDGRMDQIRGFSTAIRVNAVDDEVVRIRHCAYRRIGTVECQGTSRIPTNHRTGYLHLGHCTGARASVRQRSEQINLSVIGAVSLGAAAAVPVVDENVPVTGVVYPLPPLPLTDATNLPNTALGVTVQVPRAGVPPLTVVGGDV